MKKLLLSILIFALLSSCSDRFIKEADNKPEKNFENYGLVIFSVTYLKNPFLQSRLFTELEGLHGGKTLFKVSAASDKVFAFWVKEGSYYIGNILTQSKDKKLTGDVKGKDSVLISFPNRYKFYAKAKSSTYAGNIFIQTVEQNNSHNSILNVKGEAVKLSADISIRIRKTDIDAAKKEYKNLQNINYPLVIAKMHPSASKLETNITNILNHSNTEQGYKNFKWGSSINQVKAVLDKQEKRVLVMSSTQLIDHTAQNAPIEYFFSDKEGLLKVIEHLNSFKLKEITQTLNTNFGKSLNNKKKTWFTPYSIINLEKTKSDIILIYKPLNSSKNKN